VIEILFPNFKPDLSAARKVTFVSKAELDEEENFDLGGVRSYEYMVKILEERKRKAEFKKQLSEWSKKRKALWTSVFKAKQRLNRAHYLMDMKKVREARESVAYNTTRLEEWHREKPVSNFSRNSSGRVLESVDVVKTQKVSSAA
jgi:hypothetical protein